jgi:hypothetical protein
MFKVSNLKIKLLDNVLCREWLTLYQSLNVDPDFISDNSGVDDETFAQSIKQTNKEFGFDWPESPRTQKEFNAMHKDIESAPTHMADRLRVVHDQLHVKESQEGVSQIQIGWAESLGKFYRKEPIYRKMLENAEAFAKEVKRGDVCLGYPHVGKTPETCMRQHDNESLEQTCRLHDSVVCDIIIMLTDSVCASDRELLQWYDNNKITMFTKQDMLKYNGWARIGEVENIEQLASVDKTNLRTSYDAKD